MRGAIRLFLLYAFMAWTGMTVPFYVRHGNVLRACLNCGILLRLMNLELPRFSSYCVSCRQKATLQQQLRHFRSVLISFFLFLLPLFFLLVLSVLPFIFLCFFFPSFFFLRFYLSLQSSYFIITFFILCFSFVDLIYVLLFMFCSPYILV